MVDQLTLQTIGILLTGLTVSIASIYYMLTLRYTRRNQDLQLETRQAQLFTQLSHTPIQAEWNTTYFEVLNWEWEDYGDFEMKYGSDNNIQGAGKRLAIWNYFDLIGKLLREGLLNLDLVYTLNTDAALFQWTKWKDVIEEHRKRYYTSDFMTDWEYLCSELMKRKEELGYSWEVPATLGRYIPDE